MDNVRKLEFSVNICGQSSFTCNPPNGMCQKSTSFAGSPIYTGCGNGSPESVRFFPYMRKWFTSNHPTFNGRIFIFSKEINELRKENSEIIIIMVMIMNG